MTYNPSPIKRESVISQAAQEICRYIAAEKLSPGEALPPETRLSGMLGISRNSLREALRVLHGLGYVEKAAGQRVVVTAASQTGKSMFDESVLIEAAPIANEVRSHIAQKCAELSAERLTPAEIAELEGFLQRLSARSPAGTWRRPRAHTMRFTDCCLPVRAIPYSSRCSIRRRLRACRTSRPNTRASTIRGIWRIIGLCCGRCASATRAPPERWCASISRVSG